MRARRRAFFCFPKRRWSSHDAQLRTDAITNWRLEPEAEAIRGDYRKEVAHARFSARAVLPRCYQVKCNAPGTKESCAGRYGVRQADSREYSLDAQCSLRARCTSRRSPIALRTLSRGSSTTGARYERSTRMKTASGERYCYRDCSQPHAPPRPKA
jgi:hypothetical protein